MEGLLSIEVLQAFGLMLARTAALFFVAPILGLGTHFTGYKIAIIFSISFLLYLAVGEPLPSNTDGLTYVLMMLREVLIGVFIGFTLDIVILAVRVAGEMIGHEMGFMMARQADPVTGVQSSLITNFYEHLFILSLLLLNGHHWLIQALGDSFEIAPVGRIEISVGMTTTFQAMFAEMFGAGIVFAAPVMIFLLIVSMLLGLLARAVTTLNILELSFTLRVGISLGAMYLFAPILEPSIRQLNRSFTDWVERMLGAMVV